MIEELTESEKQLLSIHLTERKKRLLSKEFKSLQTIPEKFQFWDEKFEQPYIIFLSLTSPYHYLAGTPKPDEIVQKFQDFQISPPSNQFREYNEELIQQYQRYRKTLRLKTKVEEIDTLKKEYYENLKNLKVSKNKELYIDDCIIKIDAYIIKLEKFEHNVADLRPFYYLTGYREKLFEKELDLSSRIYEFHELVFLLNGHAIAEFKVFLRNESKGKSKDSKGKQELTLRERLIALRYLGAIDKIREADNATKEAAFLNLIICQSEQNTRGHLSKINRWTYSTSKTEKASIKKNLEVVRDAFKELGASSLLKAVEADLQELARAQVKKL